MRLYRISHGVQSEPQEKELCFTNFKNYALIFWEGIVIGLGDDFRSKVMGDDIFISNGLEYYYYQVLES